MKEKCGLQCTISGESTFVMQQLQYYIINCLTLFQQDLSRITVRTHDVDSVDPVTLPRGGNLHAITLISHCEEGKIAGARYRRTLVFSAKLHAHCSSAEHRHKLPPRQFSTRFSQSRARVCHFPRFHFYGLMPGFL